MATTPQQKELILNAELSAAVLSRGGQIVLIDLSKPDGEFMGAPIPDDAHSLIHAGFTLHGFVGLMEDGSIQAAPSSLSDEEPIQRAAEKLAMWASRFDICGSTWRHQPPREPDWLDHLWELPDTRKES